MQSQGVRWKALLIMAAAGLNVSVLVAALSTNIPWQPSRMLLDPSSQPNQVSSAMVRCVGVDTASRACHFKHLYFDREEQHFLFFGSPPSSSGHSPVTQTDDAGQGALESKVAAGQRRRMARHLSAAGNGVAAGALIPFLQLGGCAPARPSAPTNGPTC
jgi:hypothetical protein